MAVNRALELVNLDRKVTLVDLDTVEPFYTLRPIKGFLIEQGLEVVAWETKDLKGLGETGVILHPDIPWVLRRVGDVILDVGYGVGGPRPSIWLKGQEKAKNSALLWLLILPVP